MKRTPLRPRSKKRAAEMVQRRKLVAELLERFPWCARCYWARSVDLHELKNRSQGGDFLDPEQIVTLCRQCHDRITRNPALAHESGWTFWSHETVVKPSVSSVAGLCCDDSGMIADPDGELLIPCPRHNLFGGAA